MNKRVLSVLLLTAAFPLTAVAQTAVPKAPVETMATQNEKAAEGASINISTVAERVSPFVVAPAPGTWKADDLQGKQVYGAEGENIGEINDILIGPSGGINAVVVGVGGFLGIGQKNVAVDMSLLQVGPGSTQEDADIASQNVADLKSVKQNGAAAPGAAKVADGDAIAIGADGLPDRIVLAVTRQQLEGAPEFTEPPEAN